MEVGGRKEEGMVGEEGVEEVWGVIGAGSQGPSTPVARLL